MAERNWPKDIEPRSKEEWLAAANSGDPNEMQLIGKVLKALKYSARDYVTWSKEQRVETIVKHQDEAGLESGGSSKKGASKPKGASKSTTSRKKGAAKPKAKEPETGDDEGTPGGGGISEEQFSALLDAVQSNANSIEALTETLAEMQETLDKMETFVTETHYGFVCIAMGDETIRGNFEDEGIQEEFLGVPQILGGEGDDDEGEE